MNIKIKSVLKYLFIAIACLVLLIIAVCLINNYLLLSNENIDMSTVDMPQSWRCSWANQDNSLQWKFYEVENNQWHYINEWKSLSQIHAFQWVDDSDNGSVIHSAIAYYNIALAAKYQYVFLDPSRRLRRYYENFGERNGGLVEFHDTRMDEDAMQCGSGTEDKCYGWFYRARYNNYNIYIHDSGPLCFESFSEITSSFNTKFLELIDN